MPNALVPNAVWEVAETEEMKEVIGLYGKTYHFWQVDRGDVLPLGKPELMMSFTEDDQVSGPKERLAGRMTDALQVPWDKVKDRDERYEISTEKKREARKGIESPPIHEDADSCWKGQ